MKFLSSSHVYNPRWEPVIGDMFTVSQKPRRGALANERHELKMSELTDCHATNFYQSWRANTKKPTGI